MKGKKGHINCFFFFMQKGSTTHIQKLTQILRSVKSDVPKKESITVLIRSPLIYYCGIQGRETEWALRAPRLPVTDEWASFISNY